MHVHLVHLVHLLRDAVLCDDGEAIAIYQT